MKEYKYNNKMFCIAKQSSSSIRLEKFFLGDVASVSVVVVVAVV